MAQIMTNVNNYIYELDGKLYVNLTNACTNDCLFCIRSQKDDVMGANMWLNEKPDFSSVINQLNDKQNLIKNGVTFCGYGEPLLELDLVLQISKYIKENFVLVADASPAVGTDRSLLSTLLFAKL